MLNNDAIARVYKPDGKFTASGLLTLLTLLVVVGIATGVAASFVSQWFYLVLLFPVGIGVILSGTARFAVTKTKTRNVVAVAAIAMLASVMTMTAMHYSDYYRFQKDLPSAIPDYESFVNFANQTPAEIEMQLTEIEVEDRIAIQSILEAMAASSSFFAYMDYQAQIGVSFKRARRSGSDGINLGYKGTLLYWLLEVLIVTGLVLIASTKFVKQPFCNTCDNWKSHNVLGVVNGNQDHIKRLMTAGSFHELAATAENESSNNHIISLHECSQCQENSTAELTLTEVSTNRKGETTETEILTVSYGGQNLSEIKSAFAENEDEHEIPPSLARSA